MKKYSHGCTLNCFGCCKFDVLVDEKQNITITGDKKHPYTKGIICSKGKKHVNRLNHKERLYKPLLKVNNEFKEISFEAAIKILSEKLTLYKKNYGSQSVFHYYESGSGATLKGIQDVFFNFYGGITNYTGGTCWAAGYKAQKYDFGNLRSHILEDMLNSNTVFIWGRNPSNTSIHMMQMMKKAKRNGSNVIVIDPIKTDSAKIATKHIKINPSGDIALAMAMAKIIIDENLQDSKFIKNSVVGFEEYKEYLSSLNINNLLEDCGLNIETVKEITYLYCKNKNNSIYLGYGLQRYKNGGNTIRAIDALGALTGQIGKKGGGVNYCDKTNSDTLNLDPYDSFKYANNRELEVYDFENFIYNQNDIPIKLIMISKSNPLNQWPSLKSKIKAFKSVEFKVFIDMFMTDTAKHCDLIIPCTNTLESEDIVYTSMDNPYITYNEQIVKPKHELMDEYYFFQELAKTMNIKEYPYISKQQYLSKLIEPLKEIDETIDLEKIKNSYIKTKSDIAWDDLKFETPSKKYELYSQSAKEDGNSPIPIYIAPRKENKLRFLTSHSRDCLFSQHFMDKDETPKAYINEFMANKLSLSQDEEVIIKSELGNLTVIINISNDILDGVVHMYAGWLHKHGNLNFITNSDSSDIGGQITYNDTFVDIIKQN